MGQILHGSATTTEAVRRAIQNSQESLIGLAKRYGINPKTVAKWRKRSSVADLLTGPKDPKSTVLTIDEEAIVVAFRKHTLLPLDDCLYTLQQTIPHLTRSSLHRCLQRHGISRLPDVEGDKPDKKKFKAYPIGYFHIDIAEVQTAEGKLYLFVAIDRTSKFAFVQLHKRATKMIASAFLSDLIKALPYAIHTILTDNGIQFTNRKEDHFASAHIFGRTCRENGTEHRTTKVKHPWTNSQVEAEGATWLDRELLSQRPEIRSTAGYGDLVQTALGRRQQWLVSQGLGQFGGEGEFRPTLQLLNQLRARDLVSASDRLSKELNLKAWQPIEGENVSGTYLRPVTLASGKFAIVQRAYEFTLVPWQAQLEPKLGKSVQGTAGANGIVWDLVSRQRGLGIG
jgi:transposase-like protein